MMKHAKLFINHLKLNVANEDEEISIEVKDSTKEGVYKFVGR